MMMGTWTGWFTSVSLCCNSTSIWSHIPYHAIDTTQSSKRFSITRANHRCSFIIHPIRSNLTWMDILIVVIQLCYTVKTHSTLITTIPFFSIKTWFDNYIVVGRYFSINACNAYILISLSNLIEYVCIAEQLIRFMLRTWPNYLFKIMNARVLDRIFPELHS